jgi:hypothetical protein
MSRRHARSSRRGGETDAAVARAVELASLEAFFSANLYTWIRPDSRTEAAAKITQFNDKVNSGVGARAVNPAHALVQAVSGNQSAAAAPSAIARGQMAALFVAASTNYYDSNIPATNFKFLHDGTGGQVWLVMASSNQSARGDMVATRLAAGAAETGFLLGTAITSATARAFAQNGASSAVDTGDLGTITTNTLTYLDFSYVESASPEYAFRQRTALLGSGLSAAAPSVAAPDITLRLGMSGSFPAGATFADLLIANTVSATLLAKVQRYLLLRYGL